MLSRVNQKVDTKQDAAEGATPATHMQTEVEVPSKGIHRSLVSDSQQDVASVERRNNVRKMVQVGTSILTSPEKTRKLTALANAHLLLVYHTQ